MRAAAFLLASACALGLQPTAHAADLPELQTLSIMLIAAPFFQAGGGARFRLLAETGNPATGIVTADTTTTLQRLGDPAATPGDSHFRLSAHDRREQKIVLLDFRATARRCLLTTVSPVLAQSSQWGRVVEVSPLLQEFDEYLSTAEGDGYLLSLRGHARLGTPLTLCAGDTGTLALLFGTPAFDLLPMSIVSYDRTGTTAMAAVSTALEFPVLDAGSR